MPIQDRTNEFRACVHSIRSRSSISARTPEAQRRSLQSSSKQGIKSEFSRMASAIGKDISTTTIKLGKLAQRQLLSLRYGHTWLTPQQSQKEKHYSTIDLWR